MDIRPTNIPIVQSRELRMDNLFELEDGSVAILDYEKSIQRNQFHQIWLLYYECD